MLEIIIILLTEGEMKAKNLAERFSCTTKTIYRDLEYIREAGIPVIGEKGRRGGFKIDDNFIKDTSKITLKEQHKIINILKNHGSLSESQLEKVMDTLEGLFKDNKEDWINIDYEDSVANEKFNMVKDAIYKDDILKIKDNGSSQDIKPKQILIREDGTYLKYSEVENENSGEIKIDELDCEFG